MPRRLVVALTLIAFAGCSLTNPHVIRKEVRQTVPAKPTLTDARTYADRVKDEYRDALGNQAQLQSWLGLGLIPLSAAAIGLGATSGPPTAILATGLAGAAGFGAGTWLLNRQHQTAYVAGIKAVTCAVDAVGPLEEIDVTRLTNALTTLEAGIPDLERQIAMVSLAVIDLEAVLRPFTAAETPDELRLLGEAKAELAIAQSLLTSAKTAQTSGEALKLVIGGAGQRLRNAIDKITDTVDEIIVQTQRDPQALANIISSLGASYKLLTTVPEAVRATVTAPDTTGRPLSRAGRAAITDAQRDARDKSRQRLEADLHRLRLAVARVDGARRIVAAAVAHVDPTAVQKKLDGCGVKSEDIVTKLVLTPAPPYAVAKSASVGFVASGGVAPYWASVTGSGEGVTVTPNGPLSAAFTITTSKDAAGTFVISVFDSRQSAVQAQVTVGDGKPAEKPGGAGAGTRAVSEADVKRFADALKGQVVDVSKVLSVVPGAATWQDPVIVVPLELDSVSDLKKANALTASDVIDAIRGASGVGEISASQIEVDLPELKKKIAAFVPAQEQACVNIRRETNVKEDSEPLFLKNAKREPRDKKDRERMQQTLSAKPIDGTWGPNTKHQLKDYQCRTCRMPTGVLNNLTVRELLTTTAAQVPAKCLAP